MPNLVRIAYNKVWLDAKNIQIKLPLGKLGLKKLGPFKVLAQIGNQDYKLDLPAALKVYLVFHID